MAHKVEQKGRPPPLPPPLPKSPLRRAMRWVIALGVLLVCALAALSAYLGGYHLRVIGWHRCRRLVKRIEQPLAERKSLLDVCEREVQAFTAHMERLTQGFSLRQRMDEVLAPLGRPEDGPGLVSADQIERARETVRAACEKTTAEAVSAGQKPRAALEQVAEAGIRLEKQITAGGGTGRGFRIIEPASWGFLAEPEDGGRGGESVLLRLAGQHESGEVVTGLFVECGAFGLWHAGRKTKVVVYAQSADMARHWKTLTELEGRLSRLRVGIQSAEKRVQRTVTSERSALDNELAHFEKVREAQRAYLNASFENARDLAQALPRGAYARRHQWEFLAAVQAVGRQLAPRTPARGPRPTPVAPAGRRGTRPLAPPPRAQEPERPVIEETDRPEQPAREVRVVAVWAGTVVVNLGSLDGVEPGTFLVAEMREHPIRDPRNPARVLGHEVTSISVEKTDRTLSLCRPARAKDRLPREGDIVRGATAR